MWLPSRVHMRELSAIGRRTPDSHVEHHVDMLEAIAHFFVPGHASYLQESNPSLYVSVQGHYAYMRETKMNLSGPFAALPLWLRAVPSQSIPICQVVYCMLPRKNFDLELGNG